MWFNFLNRFLSQVHHMFKKERTKKAAPRGGPIMKNKQNKYLRTRLIKSYANIRSFLFSKLYTRCP